MSDFTKEELEVIKTSLDWTFPSKQTKETGIVLIKIQSMIDNYCEHQNQGSISDADYVYFCKDCNVITGI